MARFFKKSAVVFSPAQALDDAVAKAVTAESSIWAPLAGKDLAKLRAAKNTTAIGNIGEAVAKQFLADQGYTANISIQNGSGHGIDIVAQAADATFAVFEVKSSTVGMFSGLSARQRSFLIRSRKTTWM